MRTWVDLNPPKDFDPRLVRLFKQINLHMGQSTDAIAKIGAGLSPDGGSNPIVDTNGLFKLAGRAGGQIGHGATESGGQLVLSSTNAATKGTIYLGEAKTTAFDEANGRLGITSPTPGAKLEIKQSGTDLTYSPNSTYVNTSNFWTGQDLSIANIYNYVNEATADDSTYIQDNNHLGSACAVGLPSVPAQPSTATVVLLVRARWSGSNAGSAGVGFDRGLQVGSTGITSIAQVPIATPGFSGSTAWTTYSYTLTPAEITAIGSGWSNLNVYLDGAGGGIGYSGSVQVSWVQLQIIGGLAVDLVDLYNTSGTLTSGYLSSGAPFYVTGAGTGKVFTSDVNGVASWASPAALTKVDDTNVTLTLGGSPTTALLAATSITAGWTGQLSTARGGTGSALGALVLLGSASLTMTTGAGGTIFTVPTGKVCRITHVVFRDPSATMAAATNLSINGFPGTISLVNLTTANTGYVIVSAATTAGSPSAPQQSIEQSAGTNIALTCTTGAAAGTCVVDVFGYLTT